MPICGHMKVVEERGLVDMKIVIAIDSFKGTIMMVGRRR